MIKLARGRLRHDRPGLEHHSPRPFSSGGLRSITERKGMGKFGTSLLRVLRRGDRRDDSSPASWAWIRAWGVHVAFAAGDHAVRSAWRLVRQGAGPGVADAAGGLGERSPIRSVPKRVVLGWPMLVGFLGLMSGGIFGLNPMITACTLAGIILVVQTRSPWGRIVDPRRTRLGSTPAAPGRAGLRPGSGQWASGCSADRSAGGASGQAGHSDAVADRLAAEPGTRPVPGDSGRRGACAAMTSRSPWPSASILCSFRSSASS